MGKAVKLETASLFERRDVSLDGFVPAFTKEQLEMMLHIRTNEYSIPLGMGGHGIRYSVTLPNQTVVSISRSSEDPFYGDGTALINDFIKKELTDKEDLATKHWIRDNVSKLNSSKYYWDAVYARESAEITFLKANVCAAQANAFATTGKSLNEAEINMLVIELGYDPDLSWGYK